MTLSNSDFPASVGEPSFIQTPDRQTDALSVSAGRNRSARLSPERGGGLDNIIQFPRQNQIGREGSEFNLSGASDDEPVLWEPWE